MKVIDRREEKPRVLVAYEMKEKEPFSMVNDRREPVGQHIYLRARPNQNKNVGVTVNQNDILVVNILFGTLHGMKRDQPVKRIHLEVGINDECYCRETQCCHAKMNDTC